MNNRILLFCLLVVFSVAACKKDPPAIDGVPGCMDSLSLNYNPLATVSDGSCTYAEKYLPLTVGNTWTLQDTITVPIIGSIPVQVVYNVTGDTTIGGKNWKTGFENLTSSLYSQSTQYAYRWEQNTGKVLRRNVTTGDTTDKLFMDYPLDLGKSWYDTPEQTGVHSTVVGVSLVTVPAGTFTGVAQIQAVDLATSQSSLLYFAKNVGPVKAEINVEVQGIGAVNIQPVLISYTVN